MDDKFIEELESIKAKVLYCLEKFPETRNSDILLTITLWKQFYPKLIKDDCIHLEDIKYIPREDGIKRLRAEIQNVQHKFVPTVLEIAIKRGMREEDWKIALGYPVKTTDNSQMKLF